MPKEAAVVTREPSKRLSIIGLPRRSEASLGSAGRKSFTAPGFEKRRTTIIDVRATRKKQYHEWIVTVLQLVTLISATSLSISCVFMGAIYFTKCPGNDLLPIILVSKAPLISTEITSAYIVLARNHEWARKLVTGVCMSKIHTATGFLFILSGVWFCILAFWTFEKQVSYHSEDAHYCHPNLHRFTFGFVITVFILSGIFIFIFFCGCVSLAVLLVINDRLKWAKPDIKRGRRQSTVHYGESTFLIPDDTSK